MGRAFEANAAVAHSGDATSGALGVSGALVVMDGHAFTSRRIYDSFAVVSTNGVADVPIRRENLTIGKTNQNGVMLVPQLLSYQSNKISIDSMGLPAQMRVPDVSQSVTPTDRSGVLVRFDLTTVRSATVVLHDANGQPLPIGSIVAVAQADAAAAVPDAPQTSGSDQRQTSVVGYDGATYFDTLLPSNRLTAYLPDGSSCHALLDWPGAKPNEVPVIGPIICRK
ncbi:hypothetical protein SDC9_90357 [bioreactor metagenome]|uniref:Uncharacterized protein n=1 Tax=bioreactor metagenome TaxID=1076179 RepID=A0A644ZRU2_9ZZZZ